MKQSRKKNNNGQVMLISVVTLSSVLIGAAGIAGLLMIYQVRGANDAVNSAKALFAADAGIEAASFCYFKGCPVSSEENAEAIDFEPLGDDPAQVSLVASTTLSPEKLSIIIEGFSNYGKIIRTLEAEFSN